MDVTKLIHRLGVLIGAVVLGGGIALLFAPGAATAFPFNLIVADLAALGALVLGIWTARTRYRTDTRWIAVSDVGLSLATPTPGDELDELVYRLTRLREGTIEYREQIHERVRDIAIAVIMQRQKCSHEQAAQQLEDGTWTDDALAANFFLSGGKGARSSLADQLKSRFTDVETGYEKQVRAAVRAIENVGEYFDDPGPEDDLEPQRAMTPTRVDQDDEGQLVSETIRYRQLVQTHHWAGISAFGFAALAFGILASQPAVLLASAVGIAVAGYARIATPPSLADLDVTRTVSDDSPEPGDEVEVTVTVENTGETFLSDLRLIDRVPATMDVVDGSPKLGTALRSGGTTTFTYQVVAERGEHSWPLQVVGRDVSGALEREALIDTEKTIRCVPLLRTTVDMPVRLQTSMYAGEVKTKTGGEGLEFFSVRDYQPGDPESRIDWKTYARSGEFTTIDFREEKAARVVLLFDARSSSYVSSAPGEKHALNKSIDAAYDVFASLHDQGHLIGIAAFNGIPCWLGPATGTLHVQHVRNLFVEHPALSPLPPELAEKEEGRYVDPMTHIRRQLPSNTQIFLFSPLTDHYTYEVARRLNGAGHLVTIVSPDPTADRTIGQRIARLERTVRIKQLRDYGIRVVDWDTDRPLNLELEYARQRWQG